MARLRQADAKIASRERRLQRTYGIGVAEYNQMLAAQGGICPICLKPSTGRFCVDHDHRTGLIRGLLCSWCNYRLGFYRDRVELLKAAVEYSMRPPALAVIGERIVPMAIPAKKARRKAA